MAREGSLFAGSVMILYGADACAHFAFLVQQSARIAALTMLADFQYVGYRTQISTDLPSVVVPAPGRLPTETVRLFT